MKACRRFIPALFILLVPGAAPLAGSRHSPHFSDVGIVSCAEPHAAAVGMAVLREGGNAADAAVAVGFALAVTYPAAGNLGGGGFLVYRDPSGKVHALDYREKAPSAATRDMFLGPDGVPRPDLSRRSLLAVGVPGSPAGMLATLEKFGSGRITRERVLRDAIRLAEQGFPIDRNLSESLDERSGLFEVWPSSRSLFFPEGNVLRPGAVFQQPDLARVLREISVRGRAGFYSGWVAHSLAGFMKANNGLITVEDLAAYEPVEREPVTIDFKGYRLYSMPPPSSGGVVLGQILGLLAPFDLAAAGHNSARYVQRLVEAERLAFADRNALLGDPGFVDVPLGRLLSPEYLAERRGLMPEDRAGRSENVPPGLPEPESTTHFSVIDRWGGAAAVTTTLNGGYGTGAVVSGAGFLLNNEMDDFSAAPGQPNMFGLREGAANSIAPGKRMLSSMTPTVVTRVDSAGIERLFAAIGAAGGPTIITTVLQVFLNLTTFGMNVREAVDAPRFHHQHLPDEVSVETRALGAETRAALEAMGYRLSARTSIGSAHAAVVRADGWFAAWGDGDPAGSMSRYPVLPRD